MNNWVNSRFLEAVSEKNWVNSRFLEAVSEKNFEEIESLFPLASKRAQLLYLRDVGFTPLHRTSRPQKVQHYISSGLEVDVKHPETDETPLLTAVKFNKQPSVVRELLSQGAFIEARNKHTLNSPLNQAVQMADCDPEIVRALLEHGADGNTVDKDGFTPLHKACKNYKGDLRIVELLLEAGVLVNTKNLWFCTPLSEALQNPLCGTELVNLLLKFNAEVGDFELAAALGERKYDCPRLNIWILLLDHVCITMPKAWSSILSMILIHRRSEEETRQLATSVIKRSFLRCDDPHKALVDIILKKINEKRMRSIDYVGYYRKSVPMSAKSSFLSGTDSSIPKTELCNLKSFADNCFTEIKRMKAATLSNNTSIYEVIASKTGKFCPVNEILKVLEENQYPIYSDMILNKVKRTILINKLMLQEVYTVVENGDISRKVVLDAFSASCIAAYMNEDEIRNFVFAFSKPSKEANFFL